MARPKLRTIGDGSPDAAVPRRPFQIAAVAESEEATPKQAEERMTLPAEVKGRPKKTVFRTPGLTPIGQAAQTAVKRLEKNPGAVFRYARRTSQA